MDEAQLLEEAASGRKDSLRLLLEKYYKAATAVAFSVCHRSDWAREAAASGLAAVGTSISASLEPRDFGKYLIETVKAYSEKSLSGKGLLPPTPEGTKKKIEDALTRAKKFENYSQEKLNELALLALFALPLPLRETLALFCHYSNSPDELERILGISRQKLESRLKDAKAEVAGLLAPVLRQEGEAENLVAAALKSKRLEEGLSVKVGEIIANVQTRVLQRSPVKAGVMVICALGALLVVLLVLLSFEGQPQAPCDGVAERIVDKAQIRYFDTSRWLPLATSDKVVRGSSIKTESGNCALLLDGKVRIVLANNTLCDLRHFNELHKVILLEGEIYVQSPEAEVEVEASEYRVFGTKCEFDVKVETDSIVEVLVNKGDVSFFNRMGSIKLAGGKGAKAQAGMPPEQLKESNIEMKTAWALQFLR